MKPLLIIKTGSTFPEYKANLGDFDDFIRAQLPGAAEVLVAPVVDRLWLPDYTAVSGVIITGSHAMVTDREPWSEFTADWLRVIPAGTVPVLGICYGHQLLAHAWGGAVGYHPQGEEIGTVEIQLTAAGRQDPLLGIMPPQFPGHVTHAQTVLQLPPQARLLASNEFEPHHAFVLNDNQWGVQFHPEFNATIEQLYIREQRSELEQAGRDVAAIESTVREHPFGRLLLQRFLALTAVSRQAS